ncbi:hypothetical protein V1515DRAFT_622580 [Lipomyces mesembrius]
MGWLQMTDGTRSSIKFDIDIVVKEWGYDGYQFDGLEGGNPDYQTLLQRKSRKSTSCGFLVKTAEAIKAGIQGGPWDKNQIYSNLYGKPKVLAALGEWESIAAEAGVTKAALAYRWATFHSHLDAKYGDAIIFGASNFKQLQESLKAIQDGPLPSSIAAGQGRHGHQR